MRHFLVAALVVVLLSPRVNAHPHIFVDAEGGFLFNSAGELEGVQVFWLYDAFTTLYLYDALDLDKDGDGKLDNADLETIRRGETDWPSDYEGDTYLWIDGQKQKLSRPMASSSRMIGDRVGVEFELHLDGPQDMAGRSASLKLYDPGYYYAYSIPGEGKILGNAGDCNVRVNRFDPDAQTAKLQKELSALSREETPEDTEIGALFAEEIVLKCD